MNRLLLILVFAAVLGACGSGQPTIDPGMVQRAIAQTIAAYWTSTFTPVPTGTSAPTGTPTALPTDTPTPLPTDTPTLTPTATPDLRLIDADPYDFLLTAAVLPIEDRYYLYEAPSFRYFSSIYLPPDSWANPAHDRGGQFIEPNTLMLPSSPMGSGWGLWPGQEELEANGLVDGWHVQYDSDTGSTTAPRSIINHVLLFRSIAGAQIMVSKHGWCARLSTDYSSVETNWQIGDLNRVCIKRYAGGVTYIIEFSYRNFYLGIRAKYRGEDISLEYLEEVAHTLLVKLEAAPLTNIVTFHP